MKIEKQPISWLYERCPDAESVLTSEFVKKIFSSGSYIAGGFLRKLLRDGNAKGLTAYFDAMGDIDVFCHDIDQSHIVKKQLSAESWRRSKGNNAAQKPFIMGKIIPGCSDDAYTGTCTIQIIDTHFGSPEEMLSKFDLANCQIASDGKNVWVNSELPELEKNKTLKTVNLTDLLGSRVVKYIKKHDYILFAPETIIMLSSWATLMAKSISRGRRTIFDDGLSRECLNTNEVLSELILKEVIDESSVKQLEGKLTTAVDMVEYDFRDKHVGVALKRKALVDPVKLILNTKKMSVIECGDLVELISSLDYENSMLHGIVLEISSEKDKYKILFQNNHAVTVSKKAILRIASKYNEAV